jgi:hypothetical protein
LTVVGLAGLAASAVEGSSQVLAVLFDPKKSKKILTAEKFDLAFYLLCQKAFAQAVSTESPTLNQRIRGLVIDRAAASDPTCDDLANVRTVWNYDFDIEHVPIPLFEAFERRLRFFITGTELSEENIKAILAKIDKVARQNLYLYLCSEILTPSGYTITSNFSRYLEFDHRKTVWWKIFLLPSLMQPQAS